MEDIVRNDPFLMGLFDSDMPMVETTQTKSTDLVLYQPNQEDAFLTGFFADDTLGTTKRTMDFYVSPSGEAIPGKYESYIGENQRENILSQIENQTTRSVVGQMYPKNSVIGTGSLPELIRFSEQNGLDLISESQYVCAEKVSAYLTKQVYSGMISSSDKKLLEDIMVVWN